MKFKLITLAIFFITLGLVGPGPVQADSPKINIWYGHHQVFGQPAMPQHWINILGNVSNPNELASLTYSLNGGPERALSLGPDTRRLASPGDFNIDIFHTELQPGLNQVTIIATDKKKQQTAETVTVEYLPATVDTQPYVVDWSRAAGPQELAQIVDGRWTLAAGGIRPAQLGYDRLVAIGDMWWDDYEITLPVTIHGAEPVFTYPSNGASVFVVARWQGHRVWDEAQPAYGWWPLGGAGTIRWVNKSKKEVFLAGNKVLPMATDSGNHRIEFNVPYKLKLRVQTIPGYATLYSFKLWEANRPEPAEWEFKGQERLWNPLYGSVLLVAHHVDVTFGQVTVAPLARSPWEWFVLLGSYLAQFPLLLVCLIGAGLAVLYRRHYPKTARLVLMAAVLLIIEAVGGTFLRIQLPIFLHRQGWSTHEIGLALVSAEALQSLLVAAGLGLLMLAIFRWRREGSRQNDEA